ncbi:hypothetical protein [Amycolatopsis sulphurea]|nr:hypothetical protein [Amycolatopsis sulphurea]
MFADDEARHSSEWASAIEIAAEPELLFDLRARYPSGEQELQQRSRFPRAQPARSAHARPSWPG